MTTAANGPSYHVDMSQQTKSVLLALHLQAATTRSGARFVAAFRRMVEYLRQDPFSFGEPLYHLPILRLEIRQAIVDQLVVVYGVHLDKPLVLIRSFKVLS
jgi:hypothetical protein